MNSSEELYLEYNELAELEAIAQQILDFAKAQKVWLFEGEMGVGKTTLTKSICQLLDVEDLVNSPTFSIVNESHAPSIICYHFDFYRLEEEEEALDIGFEEYLESGNFCFIEWPSKVENLLPTHYLMLNMRLEDNGKRSIHCQSI